MGLFTLCKTAHFSMFLTVCSKWIYWHFYPLKTYIVLTSFRTKLKNNDDINHFIHSDYVDKQILKNPAPYFKSKRNYLLSLLTYLARGPFLTHIAVCQKFYQTSWEKWKIKETDNLFDIFWNTNLKMEKMHLA